MTLEKLKISKILIKKMFYTSNYCMQCCITFILLCCSKWLSYLMAANGLTYVQ